MLFQLLDVVLPVHLHALLDEDHGSFGAIRCNRCSNHDICGLLAAKHGPDSRINTRRTICQDPVVLLVDLGLHGGDLLV